MTTTAPVRHRRVPKSAARTVLLAAAALLVVPLAGAPATAAAPTSDDVTVVWPDATKINPIRTPYEVTITADTTGEHLFYGWGWTTSSVQDMRETPISPSDSGTFTVDFGQPQGHGLVRIWACPSDTWSDVDCTEVARSPELDVWHSVGLQIIPTGPDTQGVGEHRADLWWAPQSPLSTDASGTWELLDSDEQPLVPAVTGTLSAADLTDVDPDTGWATMRYTVPEDLPSGYYSLEVRLSVETTDFGHLDGSARGRVVVDTDAPALKVRDIDPVLYPARDDYLDYLSVYARTDERTTGTLEVVDSAGHRVYRSGGHRIDADWNYYDRTSWNGFQHGRMVPAGRYTVRLTVADEAGNTTTWHAPVRVSAKRLQWVVYRRTVTAADSLAADPYVGSCSDLATRPPGTPQGTLGFYSATKCHGTLRSAAVATTHGMYIPQAFERHWSWAQVTLNGGPASSATTNYVHLGYLRAHSRKVYNGKVFRGGDGAHVGMRMPLAASQVFDARTDRPFILWTTGLTAGSRYDVRSYTVRVRYQTLR